MRAFVGIPLDERWRAALAAACEHVRESDPEWQAASWVAPHNMHITLKFLGDITDSTAQGLAEDLDSLAEMECFELPLGRAVYAVPSLARAKMLWATLQDPESRAADLALSVDDIAAAYGIPREQRDFRPHVTLARAKRPRRIADPLAAEEVARAILGREDAMSVVNAKLYRSNLTPRGPIYEELACVQFAASD